MNFRAFKYKYETRILRRDLKPEIWKTEEPIMRPNFANIYLASIT